MGNKGMRVGKEKGHLGDIFDQFGPGPKGI